MKEGDFILVFFRFRWDDERAVNRAVQKLESEGIERPSRSYRNQSKTRPKDQQKPEKMGVARIRFKAIRYLSYDSMSD